MARYRAFLEVCVGVDETGHDGLTLGVDDLGLFVHQGPQFVRRADADDLVAADSDGLRHRPRGVQGAHDAVGNERVGR